MLAVVSSDTQKCRYWRGGIKPGLFLCLQRRDPWLYAWCSQFHWLLWRLIPQPLCKHIIPLPDLQNFHVAFTVCFGSLFTCEVLLLKHKPINWIWFNLSRNLNVTLQNSASVFSQLTKNENTSEWTCSQHVFALSQYRKHRWTSRWLMSIRCLKP